MITLLSLLLCLLLCGCAQEVPQPEPLPVFLAQSPPPQNLYDPGSSLETKTRGAIRVYPTGDREAQGILGMENTLLVFSGSERTTLTALQGELLTPVGTKTLDFLLNTRDPSLSIGDRVFSFYDPVSRMTLELDDSLQELRRIPAPESLIGAPVLHGNVLYYGAPGGIFAWDLEENIHRCLKEAAFSDIRITGVHLEGTVIQAAVTKSGQTKTLFLSADSGKCLGEVSGSVSLESQGPMFAGSLPWGPGELTIFGNQEGGTQIFLPRQMDSIRCFLPRRNEALTYAALSGDLILESYDLEKGSRTASLTVETGEVPLAAASTRDSIFLLVPDNFYGCPVLYRWNPQKSTVSDGETYITPYLTEGSLSQCEAYAQQLSGQFGLQIQIAPQRKHGGFLLLPETQPEILMRELTLLKERLSRIPPALLQDTAAHFSGLTIGLLREIQGPEDPMCLQFLDGGNAQILITAGAGSEDALYRGLFQTMETHIFTESIALDQWEDLNPQGFRYSYGETPQVSGLYLEGPYQAFISPASMTFPREDRASVFAAAIGPGNEDLFQSQTMQKKLRAICQGIRQAYRLKDTTPLPWEQYLTIPMES